MILETSALNARLVPVPLMGPEGKKKAGDNVMRLGSLAMWYAFSPWQTPEALDAMPYG